MAIRNIRTEGDEVLRMHCKPVKEITDSVKLLIKDMFDTMYAANGVGLAAPQVGIVKRIVVIDDTDGNVLTLINPLLEPVGRARQTSTEGCLSLPGYSGHVDRPKKVRVTALDENGKTQTIEAEDMLAVILCHEIDHLDGILYKDKASEYFENGSQEE
jgi:peptide deformylase